MSSRARFPVYCGAPPCDFISCVLAGRAIALPIAEGLFSRRNHVWYDEGVGTGTCWTEYAAAHLFNADCVQRNRSDMPGLKARLSAAESVHAGNPCAGAAGKRIKSGASDPERTGDGAGACFTLGITGHRDLGDFNEADLRERVRGVLREFQGGGKYCRMLNSIAEGADQLCAEIGLELGYELICPLPFPEYRNDFSGEALARFERLLKQSSGHFFVSDDSDRNAAYLEAGKYIAGRSDALLAIWDGKPQDSGCGTQAVVDYAVRVGKTVRVLPPRR